MAKKVTIKDIADMAGVSIATVSHVINRTRYVSPDLVEKIENIIIETGYHKKIEEKERQKKLLQRFQSRIKKSYLANTKATCKQYNCSCSYCNNYSSYSFCVRCSF